MAERLGKLEEQFEARWKRAYEVRHLENQNKHKTATGDSKAVSHPSHGSAAGDKQHRPLDAVTVHASSVGASSADVASQAEHVLPSSPLVESKLIRQQEVEDDEDEDFSQVAALHGGSASGQLSAASAAAAGLSVTSFEPASGQEAAEIDSEAEPQCHVAWDSSHSSQQPTPGQPGAPSCSAAMQHKERGTACLKQGDLPGTLAGYTEAVKAAVASGEAAEALAPLYSNRSHVLHKLGRNPEAAADAMEAHRLLPSWPKPLYRLAQAQLALGQFAAAVGHCLEGEALSKKSSEGHTEFTPLLDRIAVTAARSGSPAGYTGLLLEVRDAGEEAWLCRPAPYVPELDGPIDDDSHLPTTHLALPSPSDGAEVVAATAGLSALSLHSSSAASRGDALATWDYRQTAGVRQRRRTSFRSIKEAVSAARDGDRILLRRGIHNGMGEAVTITKRVLIMGEGQLGETVIDQRANSPTFRITRGGVVIKNLVVDMSGFCEAFMVAGPATVAPLIEDCNIKCSGDDGINVCEQAEPLFRRCTLTVRKCGAKLFGSGRGRFEDCVFEKCGEQAVRAMESSIVTLARCKLVGCQEDGVVAMESARVTLLDCTISGCKGPGIDCSGRAQATVQGGSIIGNVGGVWVWEGAAAVMRDAVVAGGPSHALLADGGGSLDVQESHIRGSVHATEQAWEGILHPTTCIEDPEQPTDFPLEEGPFKFVPNRYTRKQ
ncbi:hypothetical protein N2152v2_005163 [Parachlorella kessleri]